METKWLTAQSFERNQTLLEAINKLIIHLNLTAKGIDDRMDEEEIGNAYDTVRSFLRRLDGASSEAEKFRYEPIMGFDDRDRRLVRNYVEAKSRTLRYKSPLFRRSPADVLAILDGIRPEERTLLISSLLELTHLLEEHLAMDTKELFGEI